MESRRNFRFINPFMDGYLRSVNNIPKTVNLISSSTNRSHLDKERLVILADFLKLNFNSIINDLWWKIKFINEIYRMRPLPLE